MCDKGCRVKCIKIFLSLSSNIDPPEDKVSEVGFLFNTNIMSTNTELLGDEVVDDLVARKMEGLLCKLDMEKAYNHVS